MPKKKSLEEQESTSLEETDCRLHWSMVICRNLILCSAMSTSPMEKARFTQRSMLSCRNMAEQMHWVPKITTSMICTCDMEMKDILLSRNSWHASFHFLLTTGRHSKLGEEIKECYSSWPRLLTSPSWGSNRGVTCSRFFFFEVHANKSHVSALRSTETESESPSPPLTLLGSASQTKSGTPRSAQ